jgi:hypothetical protein
VKKRPKCSPTGFSSKLMHYFTKEKRSQKIRATSVNLSKLHRVNNRSTGENAPNLVTLELRDGPPGLPDFSCYKIPKQEKYNKLPRTIPNVQKI